MCVQIAVPMSMEFDEFAKQRDNGADEINSKRFLFHVSIPRRRLNLYFLTDLVDFTDEEGYGKYLDLHECYVKYINLKGIQVSYPLFY